MSTTARSAPAWTSASRRGSVDGQAHLALVVRRAATARRRAPVLSRTWAPLTGRQVLAGHPDQHLAVGLLHLDPEVGDDQDHLALHPALDQLHQVDAGGQRDRA